MGKPASLLFPIYPYFFGAGGRLTDEMGKNRETVVPIYSPENHNVFSEIGINGEIVLSRYTPPREAGGTPTRVRATLFNQGGA